jgi:hypothetical protein
MFAEPASPKAPALLLAASATTILLGLGILAAMAAITRQPTFARTAVTTPPRPSRGDLSRRVELLIRNHANAPSSVSIASIRYLRLDGGDLLVWVSFREQNQFGVPEYREVMLSTRGDSPLQQSDQFLPWRRLAGWSDSVPP